MKFTKIILNQLDEQLSTWQSSKQQPVPKKGWVNLIRSALGLSGYQLAKRMGVSQPRITQIEAGEVNDSITLKALHKAADAMDCQLVYAIVPKKNLKEILETQARKVAKKRLERVSHSMGLEAQGITKQKQKEQYESLVKELMEGSRRKLWVEE